MHVANPAQAVSADVLEELPEGTQIFRTVESEVRSYCRTFPAVFTHASGAHLYAESGRRFIDFLSGAGALNYGHNHPRLVQRLIEYVSEGGVIQALDLHTAVKRDFLRSFRDVVLRPRRLDYKVQFCGPTGTDAVEAALKLARAVKRRAGIMAFMGGYHGMSLGSLAATGNRQHRRAGGVPLSGVTFVPYEDGPRGPFATVDYIERILGDANSGVEVPAALLVETVQGEGGIYVASDGWLRDLAEVCRRHDVLLVCDDIQAGCGRTGTFFSFERAGVVPDLVTLSKSISGCGLPMALLLLKPELDVWNPGDHVGTFRGNQLAFVGALGALSFWESPDFAAEIRRKAQRVQRVLTERLAETAPEVVLRGIGLMWGLDLARAGGPPRAKAVAAECFRRGLIVERCGRDDTVLKLLPPLTIDEAVLDEGCDILMTALQAVPAGGAGPQ